MTEPERLPFEQPLGAFPDGTFRVWAPRAERVVVRVDGADHALEPIGFGVFEGHAEGDDYEYFLDGDGPFPDPCSRWQPDGLRGPSRVWRGTVAKRGTDPVLSLPDAVLYELHVGTFTQEGTFDAAIEHLAPLAELGVTAVEVMPVAEFPGRHGWGYDGVYLSAAQSSYGGPEGFARFVEAAHDAGLAVVLDVVYNHVGASGAKALKAFGPYFTDKHETFWGAAINFDDEDCGGVREWVLQSAEHWVERMGVDGLRVDAIHAISDDGARHVLRELADRVHAVDPDAVVIAESALNDPKVIRPDGHAHDAQWADDFHHCVRTLLTGEREGYYAEYGELWQLAKAFDRPFVWDGTYSPHRRRRFGAPAGDRDPSQFVVFTQNHDHVGNRALGDRLPADVQSLAAFCVLLSPFVPMLFQGEEYGEPAPFQFFSDHIDEEIAAATRDGRLREFAQFEAFAGQVPDPQDPATFERSKLTREERPGVRDLYARLIRERRSLGAVAHVDFDEEARWLRVEREGGTLVMNFGRDELHLDGTSVPPLSGTIVR